MLGLQDNCGFVLLIIEFGANHVGMLGGVVSFLITKSAIADHSQVSVTLICTVVLHSAGMNAGVDVFCQLFIQLHHVLYSTIIGDGHRVHSTVHCVVSACFHHRSFVKSVQVNDDILGALVSILKLLLTTFDTFHALSYDLHSTVHLFAH